MQITKLYLNNIKSYEEEFVNFRPGLTAISGENGAGKSTLVEAVGYALFGYCDGPLGALMREGASSAEIRVSFRSGLDGQIYESVRTFRKSRAGIVTATPKILSGEQGGVIAEGGEEVGNLLRRIVGAEDSSVDIRSIFSDVSGVPQGRLTADFLDTPQARKRKFDPLLGTEDFRGAFEALRPSLTLLEKRSIELDANAAAQKERLKDLPRVIQSIHETKSSAEEVQIALDRAIAELEAVKLLRVSLRDLEQSIGRLKSDLHSKVGALKLVEKSLDSVDKRVRTAEQAGERVRMSRPEAKEYRAIYERFEIAGKQLGELESLSAEFGRLEAKRIVAEQHLEHVRTDLDRISAVERQLPALQKAANCQLELEARLGKTRRREAELSFFRERAMQMENELGAILAERTSNQREVEEALRDSKLADEVGRLQSQIIDLVASIATIEMASAELPLVEIDIGGLKSEIEEDSRALSSVRERLESAAKRGREEADLNTLRSTLERAIDRGMRLTEIYAFRVKAVNPGRRRELESRLANVRRQMQGARAAEVRIAKVNSSRDHISMLDRRIDILQEKMAEARAMAADSCAGESEVESLLKGLQELGVPTPCTRLALAQSELGKRESVEKEWIAAGSAVAESAPRVGSLNIQIADLASSRVDVETLRNSLQDLRPVYEQFLRDSALAENISILIDERETIRSNVREVADSVEVAGQALEGEEKKFDPGDLSRAQEREEVIQLQVGALGDRLKRFGEDLSLLQEQHLALLSLQEQLDINVATMRRTERLHRVMQLIRNALRDAGPIVTKALVAGVSNAANEIFCEIMGDYSQSLEWDEEYGIFLARNGYSRSFRQLSGGEQIAAALSVRLAILRDLLRIDMAFLDEPTQNLDVTRRENLAEQIQRLSGFSQLFVISHDDTFERLLQSVIQVEKADGVSHILSQ